MILSMAGCGKVCFCPSLNHLIMRFVTNTPEDNRVALGAANDEEAREQILALLTSIARHLLNLPPAKAA